MSDNQIAVAVRRGLCRRAFVASIAALCAFAAVGAGADDGLSVARQALRDGLWELARAHARTNASEAEKLIVLESYADEGRWDEVKKALSSWGDGLKSPGFGYYRAMVAGEWDKAAQLLKASGSAAGVDEALMLEADALSRKGDRAKAERLWRAAPAYLPQWSAATKWAWAPRNITRRSTTILPAPFAMARGLRLTYWR